MPSTTLPISQLQISQFNVRTNAEDQTATTALERSILKHGLLLPLVVHELKGKRPVPLYGVHAGGRRYRALKALIDRGELPADTAVEVVIRTGTDAELLEESTAENLLRRELRDYEVYAAVARAHRKGDSPERIADVLGQELAWVRRSLRLAGLARPLWDALEGGALSIDDARAYAATEDQELQAAAYAALKDLPANLRTPAAIRAWLKIGDRELQRLLAFVGDEAYRVAGGRFELDLFADGPDDRGRVVDEGKLRQLVDEKLEAERARIRDITARADLRFVSQAPRSEFGTDHSLQIMPKMNDFGVVLLPDGDVVARLQIDEAGEPEVSYWWSSRKAKHGNRAPAPAVKAALRTPGVRHALRPGAAINDAAHPGDQRDADLAIKDEAGIGQDKVQIFRNLRQKILQALLIESARQLESFATDWLVWSQLRLALGDEHGSVIGTNYLGHDRSAGAHLGRDLVRATEAQRVWDDAVADLRKRPCLNNADLQTAFLSFTTETPRIKELAAAIVAGLALERSLNADGYRLPTHDALASLTGGYEDARIRELWTPTAEFLELLPPRDRLAIAEPFVERAAFAGWSRLKGPELTRSVLSVVTGTAQWLRERTRAAAETWVHPLLRFGPDDPEDHGVNDAAPAMEAAE